jgi:hypothetical protein
MAIIRACWEAPAKAMRLPSLIGQTIFPRSQSGRVNKGDLNNVLKRPLGLLKQLTNTCCFARSRTLFVGMALPRLLLFEELRAQSCARWLGTVSPRAGKVGQKMLLNRGAEWRYPLPLLCKSLNRLL